MSAITAKEDFEEARGNLVTRSIGNGEAHLYLSSVDLLTNPHTSERRQAHAAVAYLAMRNLLSTMDAVLESDSLALYQTIDAYIAENYADTLERAEGIAQKISVPTPTA